MTPVRTVDDFDAAFSTMKREQADGFLVRRRRITNSQPTALAELGLKYKLPGDVREQGQCDGRRLDELRRRLQLHVPSCGHLHRQDSQGRKAVRAARRAGVKNTIWFSISRPPGRSASNCATLLARADEVIDRGIEGRCVQASSGVLPPSPLRHHHDCGWRASPSSAREQRRRGRPRRRKQD